MIRRILGFGVATLAVGLVQPNQALAQDEAPTPDEIPVESEVPPPPDAPPKVHGVVSGRITDKDSGEPVPETTIDVVGKDIRTVTDESGRYQLELGPGTYVLRIWAPGYESMRVQRVMVTAGAERKIDVALDVEEQSVVDEYIIEEKPDSASTGALTLERQKSAAAADSIGRKEMGKTTDSSAAEAAQRVVGVNVVDGRFVYVRGLGERYTNALLNGSPMPSPEPDRAAVPLDLLPTQVMDSLAITKTFTPDMPGDFAGGSVGIRTRGVPEKFFLNVGVSGAYNDQVTSRDRVDQRGSDTDWLGVDDGLRQLPDEIPSDHLARSGATKPDGATVSREEITSYGRAINAWMTTVESFTPPNHGLGVVGGDGWQLGSSERIGFILAANYSRDYQLIEDAIVREFTADSNAESGRKLRVQWRRTTGGSKVKWGAFGSVAFEPGRDHKLTLIGLTTRNAQSSATHLFDGFQENTPDSKLHATRLGFVSRALTFGQLAGDHGFDDLNRANLTWALTLARATRDEPDTRDVVYNFSEALNSYGYLGSGEHFWSDQFENSLSASANWAQPLAPRSDVAKLKLGAMASKKDRQFHARRFTFRKNGNLLCAPGPEFPLDCPDDHFRAVNIGSNRDSLFLEEGTSTQTDAYDASLGVYGGYIMADLEPFRGVRVVVGERLEYTNQTIEPFNQFTGERNVEDSADLSQLDLLPSANFIISFGDKTKLRAGVTRTLARPQLRELAPFAYSDYFGGKLITGNPDLALTKITNFDARIEHFPTLEEALAVSFFAKDFENPIEPVNIPSSSVNTMTFENAEGAFLFGVELEARKSLGFLTSALRHFSAIGNLTLASSRIRLADEGRVLATNHERPLVYQAPWVINLMLDYEKAGGTQARLLYNVAGPSIVEVGTQGLPDAYEQPRHGVDFTVSQTFAKHWSAKLSVENILNSPVRITQGDTVEDDDANTLERYTTGRVFSVAAGYSY